MEVAAAEPDDFDGFLALAGEVENWFGPMVDDPDFHALLRRKIAGSSALVVRDPAGAGLLGGLLVGGHAPVYRLNWLVVATVARGRGTGSALVDAAIDRCTRPCRVDVITFGASHPAAAGSGARAFYERLGFTAGDSAPDGPEGGTRQWYHLSPSA